MCRYPSCNPPTNFNLPFLGPKGELQLLVECSSAGACWMLKRCAVNFTLPTLSCHRFLTFFVSTAHTGSQGNIPRVRSCQGGSPRNFPFQPGRLATHLGALEALGWGDARTHARDGQVDANGGPLPLRSESVRAPANTPFYSADLHPQTPSIPGSEEAQTGARPDAGAASCSPQGFSRKWLGSGNR